MDLLRDGLDGSKFSRCDTPNQENRDEADEDGKNKSPEIILGLVKDVSPYPCPNRCTYPDIPFHYPIDQAKIFPFIEIS